MKTVVWVVLLFVASFVAIGYGSFYILGGVEAGLPGGGHGKFADFHAGNKVTSFFEGKSFFGGSSGSYNDYGEINTNPFTE